MAEHDQRKHELKVNGWDRLRLDVAVADRGEVYSWVGAPKFEEDMLKQVAGTGAFGSGDFGPFAGAIFRVATLAFQKEQVIAGTIVPLYEPPDNMSPAAVRYLEKMGFDDKTFTSAILGLAAKGHLSIQQDKSGTYHLTQKSGSGKEAPLSSEEKLLKQNLFEANVLFHHLLKAPTRAGRQLLDRIEGFKLFLKRWMLRVSIS